MKTLRRWLQIHINRCFGRSLPKPPVVDQELEDWRKEKLDSIENEYEREFASRLK